MVSKTAEAAHDSSIEHFDVLIVGAGISGIGAAYHMRDQCPDKTVCVLEGLESYGGTWLIHKYPGVRSDSDLYTFGYRFKPWVGDPVASADAILQYMGDVIEEGNLAPHIRYQHEIIAADWCNKDQIWRLTAKNKQSGELVYFSTGFLWMCQGYYDQTKGHTPDWPGMDRFQGTVVHPQNWPEGLDYKSKKVIVIGSGATAATLVPNIAGDCEYVTVLQRSPTYFFPRDNVNPLADQLRSLDVDEAWIHDIVRRQILAEQKEFIDYSTQNPEAAKAELIDGVRAFLGDDYDVDTHFTPRYDPWRQRIAFVPSGDIFKGISSGKASMVTDEIETFTEKGVLLKSGAELEADIIISATGFNLKVMGGVEFSVDGQSLDFAETVTYRGMMFTQVPNMAWIMGYFRASWTLRVDLIGDFVCRLLKHMDDKQVKQVTPTLTPEERGMELLPWGDESEFNPGYWMRSRHLFPKRGNSGDWKHTQDYWQERVEMPAIDLDNPNFIYR